jgi:hypothetical protein
MGSSQHQDAAIAGLGTSGTFVVTVHGIGPYDASHGATDKIMEALDKSLVATLRPVDFNWCAMVEGENADSEKVRQLSRSILEAAHLAIDEGSGNVGFLVRLTGLLFEVLFKLSWLSVLFCTLLLLSAVPIYVRFGSFGLARVGASYAVSIVTSLWIVTIGVLLVGLVLSLLLRVAGRRRFAATLLRRLTLVLLQPVIPLVYRLGDMDTQKALRGLALFALFYGLLVGAIRWWSGADVAAQWHGLNIRSLSLVAALLAAIYLVGVRISRVISTPVKLARDIFNYIGDVQQRASIQEGLSRAMKNLPSGADVIVVGHSLGSVIALDSLCNSTVWAGFAKVSFVTCGSPILRCFQTFFPGLYFPREASDCVRRIQSQSRVIRWVNVFRAGLLGDPVGQALFAREGLGTDVPVREPNRILMRAHVNYWEDNAVINAVRGSWHELLPPSGMRQQGSPAIPATHASLFDRMHDIAQTALLLCVLSGVLFAVANAFAIVTQRRTAAEDFLRRAASNGVATSAKVTHSTTYWGYGEDLEFPVQVYEFQFKDRNGILRRVISREKEDSGFDGGLYFDSAALRNFLGREESKKKKTFDVQILYLENEADHLTLADPRLRPRPSGFPIFEVLWTGVGSIFWGVVLFLYWYYRACSRMAAAILPPSAA